MVWHSNAWSMTATGGVAGEPQRAEAERRAQQGSSNVSATDVVGELADPLISAGVEGATQAAAGAAAEACAGGAAACAGDGVIALLCGLLSF